MLLLLACTAPEAGFSPVVVDEPDEIPIEGLPGSPEGADTEDPTALWDTFELPTFALTFADDDWEAALTALIPARSCDERPYLAADLVFRNPATGEEERREQIGVRYRGHSALTTPNNTSNARWGLKLDFGEFTDAPPFHGARRLSLLGTEGDASLLRERLALEHMRAAGIPAPRANHAWVEVNGQPLGVFPLVEEADDQAFLEAHFGAADGHLYKAGGYCHGTTMAYEGADVDRYDGFEAKAGTLDEDKATDLIPMFACLENGDNDEQLRACLAEWMDTDAWLTEIAVDMVIGNVDGMAATAQNFLIYRPAKGRFVAYPYDLDLAWYGDEDSLLASTIWDLRPSWEPSLPVLPRRVRELYADDYCARVLTLSEDPEAWADRIDALADQIDDAMRDDPFLSHERWRDRVGDLTEVLYERFDEAADEARACDIPPEVVDPPEDTDVPEDTGP